jgi:DNA-binding SARP family transcriptional activator
MAVELGVLGPVVAAVDGRPVDLGRPKQRALLALLVAEADRVVAVDTIVDLLWAGEPPARATAGLQSYVSRLRRLLEPGRVPGAPPAVLVTAAPGYVLRTAGLTTPTCVTPSGSGRRQPGSPGCAWPPSRTGPRR